MTLPTQPPAENAPHREADDSEQVYFEGTPSPWGSAGAIALLGILGLAIAILPWVFKAPAIVGLAGIAIAIVLLAVPWVRIHSTRYRITNYRVDFERGLLWKRIDTLELWHVEDLSFNQSPLDRLLKLGTITIESHDDTTPLLVMSGLPSARPIFDTLKQRIISVKRQRGVIKMDIGN